MIIILGFYISFLLVALLTDGLKGNSKKQMQIVLCFLLMFVFFSFRSLDVLNDTNHYYSHLYKYIHGYKFDESIFKFEPRERYEYGYHVLERFIGKYIWTNGYAIIFVTSTFLTGVFLYYSSRYTNQIALCCFLSMASLILMHSTVRQTYAIMLFWLAYEQLRRNRLIVYMILVFVSSLFHSTALILLMFPLIIKLRLTKKNVGLVFMCGFVFSLSIYSILNLFGFSDSGYVDYNSKRETIPIAACLNFLFSLMLILFVYISHKKFKTRFNDTDMIWMAIICVLWNMVGIPFLVFSRMALYFDIYLVIVFINALYPDVSRHSASIRIKASNFRRQVLLLMVTIILARTYVVNEYKNEWSHLIPYSFHDFEDRKIKEKYWN